MTVRRPPGSIGWFEIGALMFVLVAAAFSLMGLVRIANGGKTDNGVPVAAPIVFALIAVLTAGLDLRVVLGGGVAGAARIARHLWRMCAGLFIASGSFFIGQQQVMPTFVQGSPVLLLLGFAPLPLLLFWLARVRLSKAYRTDAMAA
jgi:hypothetical protein